MTTFLLGCLSFCGTSSFPISLEWVRHLVKRIYREDEVVGKNPKLNIFTVDWAGQNDGKVMKIG